MGYHGRIVAAGVVCLFNIIRYFYYHRYLELSFKPNFFVLTAIFLAVGLWCGKQYDRAKYLSEKDSLTDTYNRLTIDKTFEKLAAKYQSENKRLGVMMIDLDNFKEINDQFGHLHGDKVLISVAAALKGVAGKQGFLARWGGDEFLLLIPDFQENVQDDNSTLIREAFQKLDFAQVQVTASIGTAVFPDQGNTLEQLIQQADTEMYRVKTKGRGKHIMDSVKC